MKLQRIDKIIATSSQYSRSEVAKLIKAKLVYVDEELITNPATKVSPTAQIVIDNEPLDLVDEYNFIVLNKPKGYICAHEDSLYPTVFDLLPSKFKQMHSIGRLDLDTSGLLFLTNDGNVSHRLTSPKHHVGKTYRVWLEHPIEDSYIKAVKQGIQLHGEKDLTKPAELEIVDDYCVDLTIYEGRYHQVKRMFAALGNNVTDLHRYAIGDFVLPEDLAEGDYFELKAETALEIIHGQANLVQIDDEE